MFGKGNGLNALLKFSFFCFVCLFFVGEKVSCFPAIQNSDCEIYMTLAFLQK